MRCGLMMAAVAAGLMAFGEEAAKPAEAKAESAPAVAVTAAKPAARPQPTPEQRAEMRAKREKFMAERRAKMENAQLEVLKKHGIEGEKAKELLKDLQEAMRTAGPFGPMMRPMGERRRPPFPAAKPEAPAAAPAAKPEAPAAAPAAKPEAK